MTNECVILPIIDKFNASKGKCETPKDYDGVVGLKYLPKNKKCIIDYPNDEIYQFWKSFLKIFKYYKKISK